MGLTENLGVQHAKYIVGRPFTSEYGEHNPGEECPEAPSFALLESFVNTGLLYRVYDEKDYEFLPPHVFSAVMTHKEALAAIEGDQSHLVNSTEHVETPEMKQALAEAQVQRDVPDLIKDHAQEAHEQAGLTDGEKMLAEEDTVARPKRRVTKAVKKD